MRYTWVLGVFISVLAVGEFAAAQPVGDVSGHWVVTTTITRGNSVDQARIRQESDLYCAQSGVLMSCWGREGNIFVSGRRDGAALHLGGKWEPDGVRLTIYGEPDVIRMTLDGQVVNSTTMQGRFATNIIVGLGSYKAAGEWKATKAPN